MTTFFNQYEEAAKEIVNHVGKNVVIGIPLGLGKPVGLVNALYQLACADSSINLTIVTGLTLARPIFKNELEKKLVEPILNRVLGNYEDLLYENARVLQKLPKNINVIEFFLAPGKFLHNSYVQQHYISSSYTDVVRDASHLPMNVLAQLVAPSPQQDNLYSLSCNSDLFHETKKRLEIAEKNGRKIAFAAEVNENLPYMYGELAEINSETFSVIIDTKSYRSIFAVPRDEISSQDHAIGLYASTLIPDNSCLQIGIGKLSNALANALIIRHTNNNIYNNIIKKLDARKNESYSIFNTGIYASTEMLSDEFIHLYNAGILKKKVYDHIGLQELLNSGKITETISPDILDILVEHKLIKEKLTEDDLKFLQTFGIFQEDVALDKNYIISPHGGWFPADLSTASSKQKIIEHCLGEKLKTGKIIHAGFFFGSVDLYSELKKLPVAELKQIDMTSIARTNSLLLAPTLFELQRQNARFVNSSLMVTLLGDVISDGLKNNQEISGVGGQYDFVSMADQLSDARSIITCRSTRESVNGLESNIVWDYANSTIPRYLRDFVVTEYGIADCRSKTDADVIKAILNITDSRFQKTLLKTAKKHGKLPNNYQIPTSFQNNSPNAIEKIMRDKSFKNYFKPYPFGSDLTPEEEILARALLYLKNRSTIKLIYLIIISLFFIKSNKYFDVYFERMDLNHPKNIKNFIYRKLLKLVLSFQIK